MILLKQGKTKEGAMNIANGLQLIGTSWSFGLYSLVGCSSTVMAPISFAVAMAVDLYKATKELYDAEMEVNIESWFKTKVNLVNDLNEKIDKSTDGKERQSLTKQKNSVLVEMGCRYRVYKTSCPSFEGISESPDTIDTELARLNNTNDIKQLRKDAPCTKDDHTVNNHIQNAANKRYTEAKVNLPFKLMSFVGMTLAAVTSIAALCSLAMPPVGIAIAATILCTIVAAYYLTKFGYIAANYKENKRNATELETTKRAVFLNNRSTLFRADVREIVDSPVRDLVSGRPVLKTF
jgi:hypothetical protein